MLRRPSIVALVFVVGVGAGFGSGYLVHGPGAESPAKGRENGGGTPRPGNAAVAIDAITGRIVKSLPIPGSIPVDSQMVLADGAICLLDPSDLVRLDARTGAVKRIASGSLPGSPRSITAGFGALWVLGSDGLIGVNPATGRLLVKVHVPGPARSGAVAAGEGSIWAILDRGSLARIDANANKVVAIIPVGPELSGVAIGYGAVWTTDPGTLSRIDPATSTVVERVVLSGMPTDLAVGAGAVWVLDTKAGVLTPIAPRTGAAGPPIRIGPAAAGIASGLGAIWVPEGRTLIRVDAASHEVTSIALGGMVSTVAIDPPSGLVWVRVAGSGATPRQ